MKKYLIIIITAITMMMAIVAPAATAEEPGKPAVGSRLVYKSITLDGEEHSIEFRVTKMKGDNIVSLEMIASRKKELVDTEEEPFLDIPRENVLSGKSWQGRYPIKEMGSRNKALLTDCQSVKIAMIRVPAGDFQGHRITCELTYEGNSQSDKFLTAGKLTLWYNARIGMPLIFAHGGKEFKLFSFSSN